MDDRCDRPASDAGADRQRVQLGATGTWRDRPPMVFFRGRVAIDDQGSRGVMHGAFRLFDIACGACETAHESRAQFEANNAMVAVVFAAASAEAFMREYLACASSMKSEEFSDTLAFEKLKCFVSLARDLEGSRREATVILKAAEVCFDHRHRDEGSEPYQSLRLLIRLRNHIIHLKPERVEFSGAIRVSEVASLVKELTSIGVIPPEEGSEQSGDRSDARLFVEPVARYCCDAVARTVQHAVGLAADEFGEAARDLARFWGNPVA